MMSPWCPLYHYMSPLLLLPSISLFMLMPNCILKLPQREKQTKYNINRLKMIKITGAKVWRGSQIRETIWWPFHSSQTLWSFYIFLHFNISYGYFTSQQALDPDGIWIEHLSRLEHIKRQGLTQYGS